MEKDTPLHKAVRYTNGLDMNVWSEGNRIIDILLDAGCDPRLVCTLLIYLGWFNSAEFI